MILTAYRYGFCPAEPVDLRWDQIEFASGALHVRRVKRGTSSTHPILGDELRALWWLQHEQEPRSPFVFTQSGARRSLRPGSPAGSKGQGLRAKLGFNKAHQHMRTCSGTPAATPCQTRGTIRAPCKRTSGIATSNTRCHIRNYCRRGLRIFGDAKGAGDDRTWDQFPGPADSRCYRLPNATAIATATAT
jgi:integrase